MLLLEYRQLQGGNSNSVLCQAKSHHPVADYFPITDPTLPPISNSECFILYLAYISLLNQSNSFEFGCLITSSAHP